MMEHKKDVDWEMCVDAMSGDMAAMTRLYAKASAIFEYSDFLKNPHEPLLEERAEFLHTTIVELRSLHDRQVIKSDLQRLLKFVVCLVV